MADVTNCDIMGGWRKKYVFQFCVNELESTVSWKFYWNFVVCSVAYHFLLNDDSKKEDFGKN